MLHELEKNPEVVAIEAQISNLLSGIDSLEIANDNQAKEVADRLRDIKAVQKKANDARVALTRPIDQQKSTILDFFKDRILNKLDATERVLKRALLQYQEAQERIRREEQRKADEAARKERERLAKRAAAAEAKGQAEKAEALAEQAQAVVAPIQQEAPKFSGISARSVWKFRVTDASKIPPEYMVPDEQKIGKVVRALKQDTVIAGIEVYEEKSLAAAS